MDAVVAVSILISTDREQGGRELSNWEEDRSYIDSLPTTMTTTSIPIDNAAPSQWW
jgi:hypothetical protein